MRRNQVKTYTVAHIKTIDLKERFVNESHLTRHTATQTKDYTDMSATLETRHQYALHALFEGIGARVPTDIAVKCIPFTHGADRHSQLGCL